MNNIRKTPSPISDIYTNKNKGYPLCLKNLFLESLFLEGYMSTRALAEDG